MRNENNLKNFIQNFNESALMMMHNMFYVSECFYTSRGERETSI